MLFDSIKSNDPIEVWERAHPTLMGITGGVERITGPRMQEKLSFFAKGPSVVKQTLHWAIDRGLLMPNTDDLLASYTLTDKGRNWKAED